MHSIVSADFYLDFHYETLEYLNNSSYLGPKLEATGKSYVYSNSTPTLSVHLTQINKLLATIYTKLVENLVKVAIFPLLFISKQG